MTAGSWSRASRTAGSMAILFAALLASACDVEEPFSPPTGEVGGERVLGLVEITITGLGQGQMTSSVIAAPDAASLARLRARRAAASRFSSAMAPPTNNDLSGDGTIQLEPLSTGSFTAGDRGAGGVRYIQAVFRVRNAPDAGGTGYDTPRHNLTFLAVDTDNTHGETAVSQLGTFDGTALSGAGAVSLAQSMLPTGAATRASGGAVVSDYADVLQVITEAEAAAVDLSGSPGVNGVFPYGFVTRCVSNCSGSSRELTASPAADQFDGVVTFAFKVPLQATAADDPFSISIVFLATDDTDTRVTESPEDAIDGTAALQQAAASLGASVTLLGTSTTNVPVLDMRRICSVRTAGNDPNNPAATLVDAGAACTAGLAADVRAVDAAAAPGGDGTSWGAAFNTLQDALACVRTDIACAGVSELWVAEGAYYPDEGTTVTDGDDTGFFELIEGLSIYGGFAGTEFSRDQRDWEARVTILSGDIGQDDTNGDGNLIAETAVDIVGANSRVVEANGTTTPITAATVLDGFTITAGSHTNGGTGGMRCDGTGGSCNPTLRNLVFSGNQGSGPGDDTAGGLTVRALGSGVASPLLENVVFTGNAGEQAGGVFVSAEAGGTTSPVFVRTTFDGNTSNATVGAVRLESESGATMAPEFINSIFNDHTSGIYTVLSTSAAPFFANSTFHGNNTTGPTIAVSGGSIIVVNVTMAGNNLAIVTSGATAAIHNSIAWGNGPSAIESVGPASTVLITQSIVEGGCPALAGYTCTEVDAADPQLVDLAGGNFRLGAASPGVDTGNNSFLPPDTWDIDGDGNTAEPLPLDLDGNARIADWAGDDPVAIVDRGAFERQP